MTWRIQTVLLVFFVIAGIGCQGTPEMLIVGPHDPSPMSPGPQTVCPIMPTEAIERSLYVDHGGKRIYFCCKPCIKVFQKYPDDYLARMEERGVILEKSPATQSPTPQTHCPITGEGIDPLIYTDYHGQRVYFCCQKCVEKFQQDAPCYIEDMESQGVVVEKIPVLKEGVTQTHCPIMGEEIDRFVYTDYLTKRVYFCCPKCIKKFQQDPAGYLAKMEAQGIVLEKIKAVPTPAPQEREKRPSSPPADHSGHHGH